VKLLDLHVRFVVWSSTAGAYVGVPGLTVHAMDRDLGPDDQLATETTDRNGRAHLLAAPRGLERRPDVYFVTELPDDRGVLDHVSGERVRAADQGTAVPDRWSSADAFVLEAPDRQGYWPDLGHDLGTGSSPITFALGLHPPPARHGNLAFPLIDGNTLLPRLVDVLRSARHTIHVQVMLFFDDAVGRQLRDLLVERARAGVRVRVMVDLRTTRTSFALYALQRIWATTLLNLEPETRRALVDRLRQLIDEERVRGDVSDLRAALDAAPNTTWVDASFPYLQLDPRPDEDWPEAYQVLDEHLPFFTVGRIDHRKMIIVDGRIALLGGQNIGREYLYVDPIDPAVDAADEPWSRWHDVFVELRGPVVRDVQWLFRERWVAEGGDAFDMGPRDLGRGLDPDHPTFPALRRFRGGIPVRILATTPGVEHQIEAEYLARIDGAQRSIWIENPYLAGPALTAHLTAAVARGVRVVLVVPGHHNDAWEFLYLARMRYPEWIRAGIELYEYGHHMTHAKVAVIDDVAIIGSANLNNSSFFRHYEVVAVVEDARWAARFRRDLFEHDLASCRRITADEVPPLADLTLAARTYLRTVVDRRF
jgi:phosphatidylserine/phosphatidylglycerophosphate/cardiolipin synthase-like enzyme